MAKATASTTAAPRLKALYAEKYVKELQAELIVETSALHVGDGSTIDFQDNLLVADGSTFAIGSASTVTADHVTLDSAANLTLGGGSTVTIDGAVDVTRPVHEYVPELAHDGVRPLPAQAVRPGVPPRRSAQAGKRFAVSCQELKKAARRIEAQLRLPDTQEHRRGIGQILRREQLVLVQANGARCRIIPGRKSPYLAAAFGDATPAAAVAGSASAPCCRR